MCVCIYLYVCYICVYALTLRAMTAVRLIAARLEIHYTHTHTHRHTHIQVLTHRYTHTCIHTYTNIYIHYIYVPHKDSWD